MASVHVLGYTLWPIKSPNILLVKSSLPDLLPQGSLNEQYGGWGGRTSAIRESIYAENACQHHLQRQEGNIGKNRCDQEPQQKRVLLWALFLTQKSDTSFCILKATYNEKRAKLPSRDMKLKQKLDMETLSVLTVCQGLAPDQESLSV